MTHIRSSTTTSCGANLSKLTLLSPQAIKNAQRHAAKAWHLEVQQGIERAQRNLQDGAKVKEKQASTPTQPTWTLYSRAIEPLRGGQQVGPKKKA